MGQLITMMETFISKSLSLTNGIGIGTAPAALLFTAMIIAIVSLYFYFSSGNDDPSNGENRLEIKVQAEKVSFFLFPANLTLRLYDAQGRASKRITVYMDQHKGCFKVVVPEGTLGNIGNNAMIAKVELWHGITTTCFVKRIEVNRPKTNDIFIFSVNRMASYCHANCVPDTFLPQFENPTTQTERRKELLRSQKSYKYGLTPGLPAQIARMPCGEDFSLWYKLELAVEYLKTVFSRMGIEMKDIILSRLQQLRSFYSKSTTPPVLETWNFDFDKANDPTFANQRINGLNPSVIKLCTVPADLKKIPVDDKMLSKDLENLTIEQAIEKKRLFICDLAILKNVQPADGDLTLCAPIGVFFLDKEGMLKPVAIQLFQKKANDNPIFLPDDGWAWTLAKLWYNNADAAYHQSIAHLGFTHLLMEGVAVATHRQLSQRHPIFKMLAPHFLFLIAINNAARKSLISKGGIIDKIMTAGVSGTFEIIRRRLPSWRMDVDGTLPEEMKNRGLNEPAILPNYHFREDGLRVYHAINIYVKNYVKLYYEDTNDLLWDWEIQAWVKELTAARDGDHGGCGLQGVPGNGQLENVEDLITILTSIIYTCSAGHAAANFGQYDQYAFVLNYPGLLVGQPPKDKIHWTEADIKKALPSREIIMDTMQVTKVLSTQDTKSLGDFEEVPTITDEKALKVVEDFRKRLAEISEEIKQDNLTRGRYKYKLLDPEFVPNSISI